MRNTTASVCKDVATVFAIIGLVCSLIITYVLVQDSNYGGFVILQFLVTFFCIYGGIFTFCLLIYAAGEGLQLLEDIRYSMNNNERNASQDERDIPVSNSRMNILEKANSNVAGKEWVCEKCGTKNSSTTIYCGNCGTYK